MLIDGLQIKGCLAQRVILVIAGADAKGAQAGPCGIRDRSGWRRLGRWRLAAQDDNDDLRNDLGQQRGGDDPEKLECGHP